MTTTLKPIVALFDLDKTLIPGDSDHAWGTFLSRKGYVDADFYQGKNDYFYGQYSAGSLDIYEYCDFAFKVLTDSPMEQLLEWRAQYMQEVIEPLIRLKRYDAKRQEKMRAALEQLKGLENLSGDLYEKITKALA